MTKVNKKNRILALLTIFSTIITFYLLYYRYYLYLCNNEIENKVYQKPFDNKNKQNIDKLSA